MRAVFSSFRGRTITMKCIQSLALRAALAGGLMAVAGEAFAAPVVWTGAAGDNLWHTPGNWSPTGVPTAADDVTIDVAGAPTILFNTTTGTRSVNSLVLNEKLSMSGGKLTVVSTADVNANITFTTGGEIAGGSWNFADGSLSGNASLSNRVSDLTLVGPAIIQGGGTWIRFKNVALSGQLTVSNNTLLAFDGDQTIANGTLILQNGSFVGHSPAGTLTVAPTATVRGAGAFFTAALNSTSTLLNQGIVEADGGTLDINAKTIVNTGTLKVSGGSMVLGTPSVALSGNGAISVSAGTLLLRGTFPSSAVKNFTRTGGVVRMQGAMDNSGNSFTFNNATGTWQFEGGSITGGTLSFADGQTLTGNASLTNRVRDLTILGDGKTAGGGTWIQFSNVSLPGTFTVGDNTLLAFDGDETLASGTIVMESSLSYLACNPSGTLTIGPAATIRGRGQFATVQSGSQTNLVNHGLIHADLPNGDLLVTARQMTNTGTIRVAPTARIFRKPNSVGGETFVNLGTIKLDADSTLQIETTPPANFAGGTLSIDLKGQPSLASNYGKVRMSFNSALELGGTLKINLVDGYTETCGLAFPVVGPVTGATGQSVTGTFVALDVPPPDFGNYQVVRYTPTSASYQILTAADFDLDGFITFEDFDAFVAAFEEGLQTSDFNQDGFLTFEDFDAFVAKFEGGC